MTRSIDGQSHDGGERMSFLGGWHAPLIICLSHLNWITLLWVDKTRVESPEVPEWLLLVFMRVGGVGVYIIRSPAAKYVPSFESRDFFFIQAAAALSLCVIVLCNGA